MTRPPCNPGEVLPPRSRFLSVGLRRDNRYRLEESALLVLALVHDDGAWWAFVASDRAWGWTPMGRS